MNIRSTIEKLVFKDGKCYGIIKEIDGQKIGFALDGKIFASAEIKKDPINNAFCCLSEISSVTITLHTFGDESGTLLTMYKLDEFFMNKMEGNND